jgi:hypothetical protein
VCIIKAKVVCIFVAKVVCIFVAKLLCILAKQCVGKGGPLESGSSDKEISRADYGQTPYRRWGTSAPNQYYRRTTVESGI